MVRLRMDSRLNGRVDESDVIQEAFVEASCRYEDFCSGPDDCSPFIWLRFLTLQKLAQLHRHHIKVKARSVGRERNRQDAKPPAASSAILAVELMGNKTTPLEAVLREERKRELIRSLENLKEADREILAMRHFEQLSNLEAAEALKVEPETAYKRYVRALKRLKSEIGDLPKSTI